MPIERSYPSLKSPLLKPVPYSTFNEIPTVLFSSVPVYLAWLPQG
jgi:hypothetical protein